MFDSITAYVLDKIRNDQSGEFTRGYLKASILASSVGNLFYARRKAGLTQEQIAKRLRKKQTAVARWESDNDGRMSLRQYVDLAFACGMIPRITLVPFENAKQEVIQELAKEVKDASTNRR